MNPVLSGSKTHILNLYILDLALILILVDLEWKDLYEIQEIWKTGKSYYSVFIHTQTPGSLLPHDFPVATQGTSLGWEEIPPLFFQ